MTERYTKLFSLSENLYATGAPVIISAGALLKDNQTGRMLAQIKLRNISTETIKAVTVAIYPEDTIGKPLGKAVEYQYLDLKAERDLEFGQKVPVVLPDVATRSFSVEVREVVFDGNSLWEGSGKVWEPLPDAVPLLGEFVDEELAKQYRLEFGRDKKNIYSEVKDIWYCPCGYVNHRKEEKCHSCSIARTIVAEVDWDELKAKRDIRLEAEEKQAHKERQRAEIQAKKFKRVIAVLASILCVVITISLVVNKAVMPLLKYNSAIGLMSEGKYSEAIIIFEELEGYKDSKEQITDCTYNMALALVSAGKYEEAVAIFAELGEYRDAIELYEKYYWYVCPVGKTVFYGEYEQDNNFSNGKEKIEWILLDREENRVLIISKYLLESLPYNQNEEPVTWETCTLRKWLNGTFLSSAFTPEEQERIVASKIKNSNNPKFGTQGGNDTTDKIFLLSIEEMEKYNASKAAGTDYAKRGNLYVSNYGYSWWWLRSPGCYETHAADVSFDGEIRYLGDGVDDSWTLFYNGGDGIRPVMWISLEP